jgi:molybdopterin/thiamine biosynthesis adenylyltransferase
MPALPTASVHSRARRAGYDPSILARSCVLIVGAGALGQNVALDLALSGVRELRIVDGDVFEDHNRSRSPLHPRRGSYAHGEVLPKAYCVASELRALHVDDQARILHASTWIEELGLGAFSDVNAIAACVDSLVARAYVARIAMLLDIPIVDGGFSGANLGMTVYPRGDDPRSKPCWSCGGDALPGGFSCQEYARYAEASGVVPAIQNGAAALAALCAEAVISLLHDREPEPRRVALDLRSGDSTVFRPRPDPVCSHTHRHMKPAESIAAAPTATVREVLRLVRGDQAMLLLRDTYIERANCPGCTSTCEVEAPMHRWRRNPMCMECGGPWGRATLQLASPDTLDIGLTDDDQRSDLTLEQLGFRAGDIVEFEGGEHAAIQITGSPDDLFAPA